MSRRPPGSPGSRREHGRREQAESFVVGVLAKQGRFVVLEPFFDVRGVGRRSNFVVDPGRGARVGQLVLVRVGGKVRGHPKVVKVIGRPDVARDVIEALMHERGLRRSFPAGVEAAARDAVERVASGRDPGGAARRDLRGLPTFTIDPVTARDFDDAISAEAVGDDGWRVWVHIADVSAFVRPGSALDREAYRRGTSVYVPGAVEPMLPEALSNGACSLVPGEERLAVTVELEVRGEDVVRSSFYRSLVLSDERLDYDRVDRVFAGAEEAAAPWAEPLAAARAAAARLRARRERAGALAVESVEPEFAFSGAGHVEAAEASVATESHQLIEHLMIAANEAVARLLSEREIPSLYRIHERPEPAAAERLLEQLATLGVPTPPAPEHIGPDEAAEIIAEASQLVAAEIKRRGIRGQGLTSLVLRSLKQAKYSPENKGHAGLHSEAYTHFTSPIRRYPDLVVHRSLLSAVGGGEEAPRSSTLGEAADWTSSRERDAMQIERAADDVANAFLLERLLFEAEIDREQDAEVIGLVGAGAFMSFGTAFDGFLPARRLAREDWWELNEVGTILTAAESGRAIRIGDPLRVVIRRIDPPRGRIELDVAR
ncbi:MAG TPA: RNB domain-containing ribonuclease [Baekduia sp.]